MAELVDAYVSGTYEEIRGSSSLLLRTNFDFSQIKYTECTLENELIDMLIGAARENKILEIKELERWIKSNHQSLNLWFKRVIRTQTELFEKKGLIKVVGHEKIITEALKILGLKQFLLNFSRIKERVTIEVKLWEKYLIWAELM